MLKVWIGLFLEYSQLQFRSAMDMRMGFMNPL